MIYMYLVHVYTYQGHRNTCFERLAKFSWCFISVRIMFWKWWANLALSQFQKYWHAMLACVHQKNFIKPSNQTVCSICKPRNIQSSTWLIWVSTTTIVFASRLSNLKIKEKNNYKKTYIPDQRNLRLSWPLNTLHLVRIHHWHQQP